MTPRGDFLRSASVGGRGNTGPGTCGKFLNRFRTRCFGALGRAHCKGIYLYFALLVATVLFPRSIHAQRVEGSGLRFPEYYDPPNERQLKTLVQGAKAQPLEGGRVLFTDARVQTWRATGEPEMEISAPECVYDPKFKAITSPGTIRVGTADGNFTITGEGFVWQQTNSTFVISNRVRTLVQPALLRAAGTNASAPLGADDLANSPLEITANQFEFGAQ